MVAVVDVDVLVEDGLVFVRLLVLGVVHAVERLLLLLLQAVQGLVAAFDELVSRRRLHEAKQSLFRREEALVDELEDVEVLVLRLEEGHELVQELLARLLQ